MKIKIEFAIKETGIRRKRRVIADVDVPGNWDKMSKEDQREYLIKPISSYHTSYGQILWRASRFQEATGAEMVDDFDFSEA